MILLPAIDIKDRTPVRLYQGSFDTVHQVAQDALETARQFEVAGAEWIHMVDLDGACEGHPVNADIFLSVARETTLKVELGGGIRTMLISTAIFPPGSAASSSALWRCTIRRSCAKP